MAKNSIELSATSDYTTSGKQFIGLVIGPDRKYGTMLEFVGQRAGKRNEITTLTVIDPGLYKVRNTTRKGVRDQNVLI